MSCFQPTSPQDALEISEFMSSTGQEFIQNLLRDMCHAGLTRKESQRWGTWHSIFYNRVCQGPVLQPVSIHIQYASNVWVCLFVSFVNQPHFVASEESNSPVLRRGATANLCVWTRSTVLSLVAGMPVLGSVALLKKTLTCHGPCFLSCDRLQVLKQGWSRVFSCQIISK